MPDKLEIARIILQALENADINFPETKSGDMREARYRDAEDAEHLGRAVLEALEENGYVVTKREAA